MARKSWHMQQDGDVLVLTRRWPARFDLRVETVLPEVSRPARLAHQVRQDVWRALRDLRGFSPCVEVRATREGTRLSAGGRLEAAAPRALAEAEIARLLAHPGHRARWLRWSA